ncbi:response regulator [Vibrio sp. T187]|uniref:response regulator n=1 Tax=Vibrio TaxID=662 RepID=UPI0010C9E14D|nr:MULTISPECIES: response regulator [Vibrio]MBW3697885.1 response regulator [Vibrio sp. T187]
MSTLDTEKLNEALIELERVKAREARTSEENRAILSTISEISRASCREQIFQSLNTVLRKYIDYDDFIVLSRKSEQQSFKTLLSTNTIFLDQNWTHVSKFNRTINGECSILFEPHKLKEFSDLNSIVLNQIGTVLLTGIDTGLTQSVIILIGSHAKNFSVETKHTLMRFRPIIERAVIDIESKERLEETVRQRTQELFEAQIEAEKANRAKSEFLAMMSHEIRTPLNSVIGLFDILQRSSLTKEQADIIAKMEFSSELLSTIISDILDLSKIEAGSFTLSPQWVDVNDTVTFVIEEQRRLARQKNLTLSLTNNIEAKTFYYLDSTRVAQVLFNLVGNAVKFTQVGDIAVEVVASNTNLCIKIKDTGIGISEKQLTQLFQPFKQADSSITRRFGGTGLGLVITKHLIHLMNGSISVKSELNIGTEFLINLPVKAKSVNDVKHTSTIDAIEETPKELSILVVEDNPTNQMVIKLILNRMGHKVRIVSNGSEAVKFVKEHHQSLDLIFMDLSMPVMDGLTTTKYIRKESINNPIVALTAHTTDSDKQKCLDAGMNAFVGKPVRTAEIDKAIKSVGLS